MRSLLLVSLTCKIAVCHHHPVSSAYKQIRHSFYYQTNQVVSSQICFNVLCLMYRMYLPHFICTVHLLTLPIPKRGRVSFPVWQICKGILISLTNLRVHDSNSCPKVRIKLYSTFYSLIGLNI